MLLYFSHGQVHIQLQELTELHVHSDVFWFQFIECAVQTGSPIHKHTYISFELLLFFSHFQSQCQIYVHCLLNNSAHCTIMIAEMCAIETETLARFTVLEIQLLAFAIIECNSCNLESIIRPNMRHFLWCEMVTIFHGLSVQLALKRRILFRKVKTNVFWICVVVPRISIHSI